MHIQITSVGFYCLYKVLPCFSQSHMQTHIHRSRKADSSNQGQWQCCTDWKSWVSTVCGMPRLKWWRCNWNCMCVWARYAVYSVCVLAIFSVYCRCTQIICLGGCKHGQAGPTNSCKDSFFLLFLFCCVIDWAINIIMYIWPTSINFFFTSSQAFKVTLTHTWQSQSPF